MIIRREILDGDVFALAPTHFTGITHLFATFNILGISVLRFSFSVVTIRKSKYKADEDYLLGVMAIKRNFTGAIKVR